MGAAKAPLALDLPQGVLALLDDTAVVFDRQAPVLADVPKVRRNRRHAAATAGDLDHDLRGTPNGGFDPFPDRRGALSHRPKAQCAT